MVYHNDHRLFHNHDPSGVSRNVYSSSKRGSSSSDRHGEIYWTKNVSGDELVGWCSSATTRSDAWAGWLMQLDDNKIKGLCSAGEEADCKATTRSARRPQDEGPLSAGEEADAAATGWLIMIVVPSLLEIHCWEQVRWYSKRLWGNNYAAAAGADFGLSKYEQTNWGSHIIMPFAYNGNSKVSNLELLHWRQIYMSMISHIQSKNKQFSLRPRYALYSASSRIRKRWNRN